MKTINIALIVGGLAIGGFAVYRFVSPFRFTVGQVVMLMPENIGMTVRQTKRGIFSNQYLITEWSTDPLESGVWVSESRLQSA